MDFKVFTDLIDTLGKVTEGLKAIASLPRAERQKYCQVMNDIYVLIDSALSMITIRLGDLLELKRKGEFQEFLDEVYNLGNYEGWMKTERAFRLCQSLRVARREAKTLTNRLPGTLSVQDWNALLGLMDAVLATEGELADYISVQFRVLAGFAKNAVPDPQTMDTIGKHIEVFRDVLGNERQRLIQQESTLYSMV